jgi:hypothetical protein
MYVPEVVSKQPNKFINVDLPEPEGPIRATYILLLISLNQYLLSTYTISSPRTKSLLISVILINGFAIAIIIDLNWSFLVF